MITERHVTRKTEEYHFDLPLNAREIGDAIWLVDKAKTPAHDDSYMVRSDGESLIFYWEVTE